MAHKKGSKVTLKNTRCHLQIFLFFLENGVVAYTATWNSEQNISKEPGNVYVSESMCPCQCVCAYCLCIKVNCNWLHFYADCLFTSTSVYLHDIREIYTFYHPYQFPALWLEKKIFFKLTYLLKFPQKPKNFKTSVSVLIYINKIFALRFTCCLSIFKKHSIHWIKIQYGTHLLAKGSQALPKLYIVM